MRLRKPYLLYLGDVQSRIDAKTAFGLRDWCREDVVGEWSLPASTVTLDLPRLAPREAARRGAGSLVVGIAPFGGVLPDGWLGDLEAALGAGLDVVSGLHTRLASIPRLVAASERYGAALVDVRHPTRTFPAASGRKRSGKRALTVGTDCALGKKYAALALANALRRLGCEATFRATGQTGLLIAGEGIVIDAVVADFVAGAAETLSPDAAPGHWDVIEGQGSLFHPAYAGVTLGLVHGSQPDAFVLCHDPLRLELDGYPGFAIPPLGEAIRRYVEAGRLTNPDVRCAGISINSSGLDEPRWQAYASGVAAELGLPVADPMRGGLDAIAREVLAC